MSKPSRKHVDRATAVWLQLRDLTHSYPPRETVRENLDLGRGSGRVKALLALAAGPMSQGELADRLRMDAPYVTVIIDSLQERGLVERTAHPQDRRRKLVRLTAVGVEAAKQADQIVNSPPPGLLALSATDLAIFQTLLARVLGKETVA